MPLPVPPLRQMTDISGPKFLRVGMNRCIDAFGVAFSLRNSSTWSVLSHWEGVKNAFITSGSELVDLWGWLSYLIVLKTDLMCVSKTWTRADTVTGFVLTRLLSEWLKICVTFHPLSLAIVHPTLAETECAFIVFQDSCGEGWQCNKAWKTAKEGLIKGTRKA